MLSFLSVEDIIIFRRLDVINFNCRCYLFGTNDDTQKVLGKMMTTNRYSGKFYNEKYNIVDLKIDGN